MVFPTLSSFALWATLTYSAFVASADTVATKVPPVRPPAEPVTAFVDVTVIPMDRERRLPHQTVVVQGERIIVMGPVAHIPVPVGAQHIDGRGKFLIPGLADMHLHLETTDGIATQQALFLLLANGVTTVRDPDYLEKSGLSGAALLSGADLLHVRDQVATGALIGPRIYTSGPWKVLPETASVAQQIAAYKAAGYDFIKIHDEQSIPLIDSLAAAARHFGLPVIGHVPDSMTVEHALTVYTSIEHLMAYLHANNGRDSVDTAADARFLASVPRLAQATAKAGVWNCPTLLVCEISSVISADTLAQWSELCYVSAKVRQKWADESVGDYQIELRRRMVLALQRAGAGLLLGTNAAPPFMAYLVPGFSLHRELQALVRAGLTPYEALVTGTRNVAAYFGTLAETGTVATGKRADLVLLTDDPLTDIHNTMHIAGVMRGGRWFARKELDDRLAEISSAIR